MTKRHDGCSTCANDRCGLISVSLKELWNLWRETPRWMYFRLTTQCLKDCHRSRWRSSTSIRFDQAVLAAILVRSEGAREFAFCELDADLQPWDKHGSRKEPLARSEE